MQVNLITIISKAIQSEDQISPQWWHPDNLHFQYSIRVNLTKWQNEASSKKNQCKYFKTNYKQYAFVRRIIQYPHYSFNLRLSSSNLFPDL